MKLTDLSQLPNKGLAIVVDGGCTNNNLPEPARCMYGSFAVFLDGKRVEKVTHNEKVWDNQYRWECDMPEWRSTGIPATNNVAECEMMCQALSYAIRITKNPKYSEILLMGDSAVVEAYTKKDSKVGKDAGHLAEYQKMISGRFQSHPYFSFRHLDEKVVKSILGH